MLVSKTVVNRPTTFFILFALVFGFGIYTASRLAIDLFPEIDPPILVLSTSYQGAGPEEIEDSVTRLLESAVSNVSNVEQVNSTSREGQSQLIVQFTWGTNMDEATNEVRDRLDFVRNQLPDGADSPQIFKFDPAQIPILFLQLSGDRSPEELRDIGEDTVQTRIEQLDGVALATIAGGRERAVRVEIPQDRLEAYNLTFNQVAQKLRQQNVSLSAGSITEGRRDFLIQTDGEFKSVEDIRDTVILRRAPAAGSGGNPEGSQALVRLGDIAEVEEGLKDERTAAYVNGNPGVFVIVQRQSGENAVQTADNVLNELSAINDSLPSGISLSVLYDTTDIIRESLETVSGQALMGALFAVLVLFFFLRSPKATAVIAVAIPVSIVVTLMLMYFFDLTLNIMTLAGLALGVGLLVDNSIVILENIYRYREKGTKLKSSAIFGAQEMASAIVAATLTSVFVFLPIALFRAELDLYGELFAGLAFTVVIALLSSLAVALFLVPVLASKYLPLVSRKQEPLSGVLKVVDDGMNNSILGLANRYKRGLGFALRHKVLTVLAVIALFGGTVAMIPLGNFELLPSDEGDAVEVEIEMPVGTTLDETRRVAFAFQDIVEREVEGYEDIFMQIGGGGGPIAATRANTAEITITLPPFGERIMSESEIQDALRPYFDQFPDAEFRFGTGMGGTGPGMGGSAIDIRVRTNDLDRARIVATQIRNLLEDEVPEATEPSINLREGLPQVNITVDRRRMAALGLDVQPVASEIRANIDGIIASQLRRGGDQFDILLRLPEEDRSEIPDLTRIFVMNEEGRRIPLESFAELERTTGPVEIRRENQARTVRVNAGVAAGANIAEVEPRIRALVAENIPLGEDLSIEYAGDYEDLMDYGRTLLIILLVSVLLVFGVMASVFESFLDPFIIIFTVPLTVIGVVWLYLLVGQSFSLFTVVGMVMLVGIVVNNGIVLVNYTNLLRKRGLSIRDACIEAGGHRLRPIMMTSLTSVLALAPVAFLEGEGTALIQPIGLTVVGGLAVATVLTLFFVPVLYAVFNGISDRHKTRKLERKLRRRERAHRMAAEHDARVREEGGRGNGRFGRRNGSRRPAARDGEEGNRDRRDTGDSEPTVATKGASDEQT